MTVNFSSCSIHKSPETATYPIGNRFIDMALNVKAFGAVGDGAVDDTSAIQAAINAAATVGLSTGGASNGSDVYFPPGIYKVTAALTDANIVNAHVSIRLIGAGKHCVLINGNFNGYIINVVNGLIEVIEGLYVKNDNAAGGGIVFGGTTNGNSLVDGSIRRCEVQGFNAIDASTQSFNTLISDCDIIGPSNAAGSVGIYTMQTGIYNCSVVNWEVGVQAYNVGLAIIGSRFEVNNTAIMIGKDRSGTNSSLSGFIIAGLSTERNNTAIYLNTCSGGLITGATITGTVDVAGTGTPTNGIFINNATAVAISGVLVGCKASNAGIDISAVGGSGQIAFEGVRSDLAGGATGVNWKMPTTNHSSFCYTNCNNPSAAFTFVNLPGSPVEGMQFDVTDSNTATWGATAAAGGSNHVLVRYNGSNWTVVGK